MGFMKDWKASIKGINKVHGMNLEIEDTNRRNYVILKDGSLRFLISYHSLVALSVNDKVFINENYTRKTKRGSITACSVTTGKHLNEFCKDSKHWSENLVVEFDDTNGFIPYLSQFSDHFNLKGVY